MRERVDRARTLRRRKTVEDIGHHGAGVVALRVVEMLAQIRRRDTRSDPIETRRDSRHDAAGVLVDLGQIFASTLIAQPRVCAAIMGILIKGLGADHVCWGTDAVWTGAPQWQIEGLRRLEIPEDMQAQHGFAPLGGADSPVKRAIFGDNNARLYGITGAEREAWRTDRLAEERRAHWQAGALPSNIRYGYVNAG